jgi:hypothetical protein
MLSILKRFSMNHANGHKYQRIIQEKKNKKKNIGGEAVKPLLGYA